jgi:hypothetical protein
MQNYGKLGLSEPFDCLKIHWHIPHGQTNVHEQSWGDSTPPQMVKVQRNDTFLHGAGKSNHRLVGKMEGVSETQPITWSSCTSATVKLNYTTTSETMEVTGLYCFSRTFKSLIHSSVRPTIQVKWE